METVLLVIHLLIALALVAVVLLQRSEGGALGIGGGGGGAGGGLMSARGTANVLTRATAILAACFMATSLALAVTASQKRESRSVLDEAPVTAPAGETQPEEPSVPLSE